MGDHLTSQYYVSVFDIHEVYLKLSYFPEEVTVTEPPLVAVIAAGVVSRVVVVVDLKVVIAVAIDRTHEEHTFNHTSDISLESNCQTEGKMSSNPYLFHKSIHTEQY